MLSFGRSLPPLLTFSIMTIQDLEEVRGVECERPDKKKYGWIITSLRERVKSEQDRIPDSNG